METKRTFFNYLKGKLFHLKYPIKDKKAYETGDNEHQFDFKNPTNYKTKIEYDFSAIF